MIFSSPHYICSLSVQLQPAIIDTKDGRGGLVGETTGGQPARPDENVRPLTAGSRKGKSVTLVKRVFGALVNYY